MSGEGEVWNIMTRTKGGTVSLLKNLTEDQARETMRRLAWDGNRGGDPWSDHAIYEALRPMVDHSDRWHLGAAMYDNSDGRIVQVDCWGPPGAVLEVWPKPDDYDERYAKALEAAKLVKEVNDELAKSKAAWT